MHYVIGAIVGFIVGCTTPGLIARLRTEVKGEVGKGVSLVDGEVKAAEADIQAATKKL